MQSVQTPPKGFGKTVSSQYTHTHTYTQGGKKKALQWQVRYFFGQITGKYGGQKGRHIYTLTHKTIRIMWLWIVSSTVLSPLLHFVLVVVWTAGGKKKKKTICAMTRRKKTDKKEHKSFKSLCYANKLRRLHKNIKPWRSDGIASYGGKRAKRIREKQLFLQPKTFSC